MKRRSLWLKLFAALALFVAAPTILAVTLSDLALQRVVGAEIGKAALEKLRVAHGVETILEDLVKTTGMRLALDPELRALSAHHSYAGIVSDGAVQYAFRRYLDELDHSVRTNPLIHSLYIVFDDTDYVLSTVSGTMSRVTFVDAPWLNSLLAGPRSETEGTLLPSHVPGGQSSENRVLSYVFPLTPYLTELKGLVIVNLLEREYSRLINGPAAGGRGFITLVDSRGVIVSDPNPSLIDRPWDRWSWVEQSRKDGLRDGILPALAGAEVELVTWFQPDALSWTYVGTHPLAEATANITAIRAWTAGLALLVVAAGLILSYLLSRRFFHPVRRLIHEMSRRIGRESEADGNELVLLSGAFDVLLKRETQLFQALEAQRRLRVEEGVRKLLHGEGFSDEPTLGLTGRSWFAGALVIDGYVDFCLRFPPEQRDYLKSLLLHMAEQTFLPEVSCRGAVVDARSLGLIFATDLVEGGDLADRLEEGFEALGAEARSLIGTSLTLGVGSRGPEPAWAASSWSEAEGLVNQRFLHGHGQWFWQENPEVAQGTVFFLPGIERGLATALEAADQPGIESVLASLHRELRCRHGLGYDNARLILDQLAGTVVRYLVERQIDIATLFGRGANLHRGLSETETLEEALAWLKSVLDRVIAQTDPGAADRSYVAAMVSYIRENYRRDIGVEAVANQSGLSYSHARKVFENEIGESIADHIEGLRIEEARQNLAATGLAVDEVARLVGYNSVQTFHRAFKKRVGLTPGAFRKRRQKR